MEELTLQQLSLILDQDIILVKDEAKKLLLAKHLKNKQGAFSEVDRDIQIDTALVEEPIEEEVPKITFEGNFEKQILVIFQGTTLESSLKEFLMNVLGAAGCSLQDVALASSEHLLELPPQSIEQLRPKLCMVFGTLNHPVMQVKTSNYEVIKKETTYFFTDTLKDLNENVTLKRNLWNGIQVLFQIKKP